MFLLSRPTERFIKIDTVVQEEVLLNREEITSYTVDKKNQTIKVEVTLTGDDTNLINTETHLFFSHSFISEPTEEDLWKLIDTKRSGA